ncbi:MAG: hypothetical protein OXI01_21990 [Albidovulum sp.]|nr:hypothetical protein [Albidovulum sp.]
MPIVNNLFTELKPFAHVANSRFERIGARHGASVRRIHYYINGPFLKSGGN